MSDAIPLIQKLITRAKGLNDIYNLVNTRLTTARGALLDRLSNLTGPVALQADLGTPADPPNMTSTVFAAVKQLDLDLASLHDNDDCIECVGIEVWEPFLLSFITHQRLLWIDPFTRVGCNPTFVEIVPQLHWPFYLTWPVAFWDWFGPDIIEAYCAIWGLGSHHREADLYVKLGHNPNQGFSFGTNALRLTRQRGTTFYAPPYFLLSGTSWIIDLNDGTGTHTIDALTVPGGGTYNTNLAFTWTRLTLLVKPTTPFGKAEVWINNHDTGLRCTLATARGPYYFHLSRFANIEQIHSHGGITEIDAQLSVWPQQYQLI